MLLFLHWFTMNQELKAILRTANKCLFAGQISDFLKTKPNISLYPKAIEEFNFLSMISISSFNSFAHGIITVAFHHVTAIRQCTMLGITNEYLSENKRYGLKGLFVKLST